ncbi:hypothetical protein M422DRAFT_31561 [Sphaerobolus stellatus SS14]|uniref:Uncharacterized protein n=1 Tax=Sphaerobolus stellatus (strain SS14) TaxID=990650 RepID=A0A0C9VK01_SPHS4|nr:hypothetical protein M422DRAFT_31561 [Sphaerobolus stellatus SS14]
MGPSILAYDSLPRLSPLSLSHLRQSSPSNSPSSLPIRFISLYSFKILRQELHET